MWVECPKQAWPGEVSKRNAYLKLVPNRKWFLTLDSDEILCGAIAKEFARIEKTNFTCVYIPILNFNPLWKSFPFMELLPFRARAHIPRAYRGITIPKEKWSSLAWIGNRGAKASLYQKREGMKYCRCLTICIGKTVVSRKEDVLKDVLLLNMKFLKTYEEYIGGLVYREKRPKSEL